MRGTISKDFSPWQRAGSFMALSLLLFPSHPPPCVLLPSLRSPPFTSHSPPSSVVAVRMQPYARECWVISVRTDASSEACVCGGRASSQRCESLMRFKRSHSQGLSHYWHLAEVVSFWVYDNSRAGVREGPAREHLVPPASPVVSFSFTILTLDASRNMSSIPL